MKGEKLEEKTWSGFLTVGRERKENMSEVMEMTDKQAKKNKQQELETKLLKTLAKLGDSRVTDSDVIRQGKKFIIPETMDEQGAVDFLVDHIEQQETETRYDRTFRYRPWDGANALQNALMKVFGTAGLGKATWSFFTGRVPPQMISINVGHGETRQVPWGEVSFPIFQGTMYLLEHKDDQWGNLFRLIIDAPRKYAAQIEGLFRVVQDELENYSIYKGQVIDGSKHPDFLDLHKLDASRVVYSDEVFRALSASVWSLIRYTETMRTEGLPLKRSILLGGDYGTGKTLTAGLTAQVTEKHGWTFIFCRPGKDDLGEVMATARLYQPAVVFFEDVDVVAETAEKDAVTELLDIFDGITSKDTEIIAMMTTNHIEKIHRAMMRPGRLDALIQLGGLDRSGVEKLIKVLVPEEQLSPDIDFDAVHEAMEGYLPAFVREAVDRARWYALDANDGVPTQLQTENLVGASEDLRVQFNLMNEAGEGVAKDPLGAAVEKVVVKALDGTDVVDTDGDKYAVLVTDGKS